jgi:DNA-binding NtrC family response regulator
MALEKILVVDDEPMIRRVMEDWLRAKRYSVQSAVDLADAIRLTEADAFDLIFVDRRLPDGEGTELLPRLEKQNQKPFVILMTGMATIESAVAAVRFGAFDYLIKPFSKGDVELIVNRAEMYSRMLRVNRHLSEVLTDSSNFIGKSASFHQLKEVIRKVAPTEATVLIQGENGTGKELVAREVYHGSGRASGPYIKVNCAAMPENLIESEFFGHEKGSFTGATERRIGRFELADGGTLLLDEVSEIPLHLQAKLLRVLQEREFERVGGSKTIKVDVRMLATTNRDLRRAVEKGDFREDLFYRLNVVPIQSPPLRERRDDIALLAEHFLAGFARKHGVQVAGFAPGSVAALEEHAWPGNIRELQNTIERAVILTESGAPIDLGALNLHGAIRAGSAPVSRPVAVERSPEGGGPVANGYPVKPLHELERQHILYALKETGGNRTRAADLLQISIRTLRNKLKEYSMDATVS